MDSLKAENGFDFPFIVSPQYLEYIKCSVKIGGQEGRKEGEEGRKGTQRNIWPMEGWLKSC